jgi:hypothetical protein
VSGKPFHESRITIRAAVFAADVRINRVVENFRFG